jgi:hypothetical protein
MDEHVVTRVNDGWYVCDVCGQTGSERWAILHQFPSDRRIIRPTQLTREQQ